MNLNVTMFIQTLVFFVLAWVTMKFIWPPLIAAIEARQQKIADGLAAADKGERSLAEGKVAAAELIKEARIQASKIIEQANRRSSEVIGEARNVAIAEGQRLLGDAQQEVSLASTRAREELRKQVGAIALTGASKLLGREIDAKAHADLLDQLAVEIERG